VSWFVMEQEIPVSPGDTRVLEKYAEQDGRPVQPLNRRFVLRSFSV
jgi:carbonic anhydrase